MSPRRVPEPATMASLLAKDAYLQGLARKICSQPSPEPQKRKSGTAQPGSGLAGLGVGYAPAPPRAACGWVRHVGA